MTPNFHSLLGKRFLFRKLRTSRGQGQECKAVQIRAKVKMIEMSRKGLNERKESLAASTGPKRAYEGGLSKDQPSSVPDQF